MATEVPSFEKVVDTIQDLIKTEQESINARLDSLVDVATSFQEKCKINIKHNSNQPKKEKIIPVLDNFVTEYNQEIKQDNSAKVIMEKY